MFSKLNNYQKVVILWGLVCLVGFTGSQLGPFLGEVNPIFGDVRFSLVSWLVLTAIALFFQVYLMWYDNFATVATQIVWVVIAIGGWVLTYFKLYGYVLLDYKSTTLWLGLAVIGMVLTGLFNKNNLSYYILALAYAACAVIIQLTKLPFELIIVGGIFFILGIVDAFLEYSALRKGLAEV